MYDTIVTKYIIATVHKLHVTYIGVNSKNIHVDVLSYVMHITEYTVLVPLHICLRLRMTISTFIKDFVQQLDIL